MEYLALIFLHVSCGLVWAGGAITAGFFVVPAVLEAGPAGGAVMAGVVKRSFPLVMTATGLLTVLTGIRLYMLRFSAQWLATAEGAAITVGGLLAIAALIMGVAVQKPTAERLGALGAAIRASGGPPTAEQTAEMAALSARLGKIARVGAAHLAAAVVLMAAHRLLAAL